MPGRPMLAAVVLLALMVRLLAAWHLDALSHGLASAHHEHQSIARSVAEGNGFRYNFFGHVEQPYLSSHQAPLVPGLLALMYGIYGIESQGSLFAMLSLQMIVSTATVALLMASASRLASPFVDSVQETRWVVMGVGLVAAFYPPLIISGQHIQALVWNLFWLALSLWSYLRFVSADRLSAAWRAGLLFVFAGTGGLLTDPILGAPIAGLLVCYVAFGANAPCVGHLSRPRVKLSEARWPRRFAISAALALGIGLGISPWIVRNYQVHGQLIFIKDSFWFVFWQGNNPQSAGTDKLLVNEQWRERIGGIAAIDELSSQTQEARDAAVGVNSVLTEAEIDHLKAMPTETARMAWFRERILAELANDPLHYLRMIGTRALAWVWFDPTNPRSFALPYRLSYLTLVALAVGGLLARRGDGRRWLPALVLGVSLTAVHLLIITSARFRIPLEMLLLLPAGDLVGLALWGISAKLTCRNPLFILAKASR